MRPYHQCKAQEVREVCTEFSGTRQGTHIETYSKFKDWSCLQWHNIITNFGKNIQPVKSLHRQMM